MSAPGHTAGPDAAGAVRAAWSAVRTAALINLLGMPIELVAGAALPGVPAWPALLSMAVGLAILVATLARGRDADPRIASALFVVNAGAVALAFLARDPWYALADRWAPFQGTKLACFVVALLAPGLGPGAGALALHVGSSLLSFALLPPATRASLGPGEPWITIMFGVIGLALLVHRMRREELQLALGRAQEEAAAARRLASTVLAIRDLANTPLQTIAVTSAVLARLAGPAGARLAARQERAFERLRALNRMLARYDAAVPWEAPSTAFDARSRLSEPGAPEPG